MMILPKLCTLSHVFNKGDNKFNNENIQFTDGNTLNTLTSLSNWHFCKEDDLKYNTYISRDTTVQSRVIDLKGKLNGFLNSMFIIQ